MRAAVRKGARSLRTGRNEVREPDLFPLQAAEVSAGDDHTDSPELLKGFYHFVS